MSINQTILTLMTIGLWVTSVEAFDCAAEVRKLEECGAATDFVYGYEQICIKGEELSQVEISSILKKHDLEMGYNDCLASVYVEPRHDPTYTR